MFFDEGGSSEIAEVEVLLLHEDAALDERGEREEVHDDHDGVGELREAPTVRAGCRQTCDVLGAEGPWSVGQNGDHGVEFDYQKHNTVGSITSAV